MKQILKQTCSTSDVATTTDIKRGAPPDVRQLLRSGGCQPAWTCAHKAKTFAATVLPPPPASLARAGRAERQKAGLRCRGTPSPLLLILTSSGVPPSPGSPGQECACRSDRPAVALLHLLRSGSS